MTSVLVGGFLGGVLCVVVSKVFVLATRRGR
jgi:hypothetical protein